MARRMTMRAAQFHPDTQSFRVNKVPIPTASGIYILVKIASASLCHSDLMPIEGNSPTESDANAKPVTIGHEGVGIIEAVGDKVKGFKVGDRVGFLATKNACFECEACQIQTIRCESGQQLLHGFSTDGFFAQYAVVDSRAATTLPSNLDLRTSSPIFCAGLTAYYSVSHCELQPGQWLGVLGCGGLGQMATQYAKAMGLKVVGLDINESALAAVRELGADATFNTKSDGNYLEKLKQLTGGGLHGLVFVSNAHAAFAPALDTLRTNGIMMVTGVPIKDLPINAMDLVTGRYRIKGGRPGVPHEMKDAVEFTAKHGIVPKMVFYRLDEINTMIELMKKGEVGGGRMGVDFSNESDFPREAKL